MPRNPESNCDNYPHPFGSVFANPPHCVSVSNAAIAEPPREILLSNPPRYYKALLPSSKGVAHQFIGKVPEGTTIYDLAATLRYTPGKTGTE
jgi:hypothetical protein